MEAPSTQPLLTARIHREAAGSWEWSPPLVPRVREPQTIPNESRVARWLLILQTAEKNSGEDMGGEASRIHLVKDTSWNDYRQSLALPF